MEPAEVQRALPPPGLANFVLHRLPWKDCSSSCSWLFSYRSRYQRCSVKKSVLRNFAKFTGKHLRQSLLFNKIAGLRLATLLKRRFWHERFPVNFVKFLRTLFLQNTFGWLLLFIDVLSGSS